MIHDFSNNQVTILKCLFERPLTRLELQKRGLAHTTINDNVVILMNLGIVARTKIISKTCGQPKYIYRIEVNNKCRLRLIKILKEYKDLYERLKLSHSDYMPVWSGQINLYMHDVKDLIKILEVYLNGKSNKKAETN